MALVSPSFTEEEKDHDNGQKHRPTNERGERVVPSDLDSHRLSHRFRAPCCLCPMDSEYDNTFVEAAIYAAPTGRYVGEYVAQCAERECGYLGGQCKPLCYDQLILIICSVNLERIYNQPGVPLRYYPQRGESAAPIKSVRITSLSMKTLPQ